MSDAREHRTAFFGSSGFAVPSLERLVEESAVIAVYTRPPQPAGRGGRVRETPVARASRSLGIEPRAPKSLGDPAFAAELEALKLDFGIVASFGALIPEPILAIPRHGFWNVHPSLLPRWRGAAPVQRAILTGDRTTGVSIMRVVAELDAGPVALAEQTTIGSGETAGELESRLATNGADLLVQAIACIDSLEITAQDPGTATYAEKITREDERIDWREDSDAVLRRLRALNPRPGAWSMLAQERIRILAARKATGTGTPGRVLDDQLLVACGVGAIRVLQAQRQGKRVMGVADMLRGFPIPAGSQFV